MPQPSRCAATGWPLTTRTIRREASRTALTMNTGRLQHGRGLLQVLADRVVLRGAHHIEGGRRAVQGVIVGDGDSAGDARHDVLVSAAEAGDDVRLDTPHGDYQVRLCHGPVDPDRRPRRVVPRNTIRDGSSQSGFSKRRPAHAACPTRCATSCSVMGRWTPSAGTTVTARRGTPAASSAANTSGRIVACGVGRLPSSITSATRLPGLAERGQRRRRAGRRKAGGHLRARIRGRGEPGWDYDPPKVPLRGKGHFDLLVSPGQLDCCSRHGSPDPPLRAGSECGGRDRLYYNSEGPGG